jgi:hypothetical protein
MPVIYRTPEETKARFGKGLIMPGRKPAQPSSAKSQQPKAADKTASSHAGITQSSQ